jgi:hypothetical protein
LQEAGVQARQLWLQQMRAADDIVAVDDAAVTALNGQRLRVIGIAEAIALALAAMTKAIRFSE